MIPECLSLIFFFDTDETTIKTLQKCVFEFDVCVQCIQSGLLKNTCVYGLILHI